MERYRCTFAYFDSEPEELLLITIHIPLSYDLNAMNKKRLPQKGVHRKKISLSDGLNVMEKCENWNSFFAEVVDETLKQIFKKEGAKAIYKFLTNSANLRLEEAAEKPEVFSANLERLMVSAARVIEQIILKNLYSRLGLKFEEKNGYEFPDYIRELRRN